MKDLFLFSELTSGEQVKVRKMDWPIGNDIRYRLNICGILSGWQRALASQKGLSDAKG